MDAQAMTPTVNGQPVDSHIEYGLRLNNLFGLQYYNYMDDGTFIESVFAHLNLAHTGVFYGYLGFVWAIATLIHVYRKQYVKRRNLRVKMAGFANFGRRFRAFFLSKGYFGLPTKTHTLVVVIFCILNVWVCAFSSKPELQLIQLARKAGWFSIINGTLLIFLAMKNSPLGWLMGLSYEKLNVFHRWVAIIALIEGAVHTIAVAVGLSRLVPSQVTFLLTPANVWGIITLGLWIVILASFYLLKRIRYEIFYLTHLVLFPATFIACILHNYHSYGPIGAAFIIYFIDRLIRYNRMYWHNRYSTKLKAKVQLTQDNMTIVKVPRGNLMWRPGTHAFLNMPEIRRFESHPFSIASVGDDVDTEGGKKTVDFIIKPEDGFTKAMNWKARKIAEGKGIVEERELRAIIDGPYGALPNFNHYDNLLLYASGSGITFTLPIALSAVRKARVRYIEFIWSTKKAMSYDNIRPQLEELARGGVGPDGQQTHVVIRLHETDPDKKNKKNRLGAMQRMMTSLNPQAGMSRMTQKFSRGRPSGSQEEESSLIDNAPAPSHTRGGHGRAMSGDVVPGEDLRSPPIGQGVKMGKRESGFFKAPTREDHEVFDDDYNNRRDSRALFGHMSDDDPDPDEKMHYSDDDSEAGTLARGDEFSDDEDYDEKRGVVGGAHQDVRDALDKYIYEGRPRMDEIIRNFVSSCGPDETCALAACGPGSDGVRANAVKHMKRNGPSLSLFVEEFGW